MRSMRDVVSMKGNGRRQGEEASTPREQLADVCVSVCGDGGNVSGDRYTDR